MKALGIDIGTTSLCVAGYEEREDRLSFVTCRENSFLPETFEQDPEQILQKVMEMLEEAERNGFGPEEISAVGISSQMHGILYLDAAGRAVSPLYTWKDERGKQLRAENLSYETYLSRITGLPLFSGYGTVTHFYLGEKGEIPGDAVKFAGIGDYLAMRLTGRDTPLTEDSMAAGFGGFDLKNRVFFSDLLARAGVATKFYPGLCRPGEMAGVWRGVPVSCAFGDNQASFYGALERPEEQVSVNVGTGSQVSVFDRRLSADRQADVRPFFGKGFLYVGASTNGGKVYERLGAFFEETIKAFTGERICAYEGMARLGAERKDTGLRVSPLLYGERGGGGKVSGGISDLTCDNLHPADLIRAWVRGMAEELHRMYECFPAEIRAGRREIVASGNGMRKNPLLIEEVENLFGMPVILRETEEEAAAGAAKAALRNLSATKA